MSEVGNNNGTKIGEVLSVPRCSIRTFSKQPRRFFDQDELNALAGSIRSFGQIVPGIVKENSKGSSHKWELVDGQRRFHALGIAEIDKMKVTVEDVRDPDHQFLLSVMANFGRAEHSPLEITNAIVRFRKMGMSVSAIARIFAHSEVWVYKYLQIAKLEEPVLEMMLPEVPVESRLTFIKALEVVKLPKRAQEAAAKAIVGPMRMVHAKRHIREVARGLGARITNPKRTPNKDYNLVTRFVVRMVEGADDFKKRPQGFFDKIFGHRGSKDADKIIADIEGCIVDLKKVQEAIKQGNKGR